MFNKKRALKVTMIKDEPQNGMTMTQIKSPNNFMYELGMLIDMNVVKVAKVVITVKAVTTLLNAAEHVVVTKVK